VEVISITDGDTIKVCIAQREETVRLIGIDTPESTCEVEPFGKEAAAYTAKLAGKTVYLELGARERDRFGRLLAYVWLSEPKDDNQAEAREKMFNAELLLQGYAALLTVPPNVKYSEMFVIFEREAREARRGKWEQLPAWAK